METKTCSRCGQTLPLTAFSMSSDKRREVQKPQSQCKGCVADKAKAWQEANKARAHARQKEWREANRDQWNTDMAAATRKRQAAKLLRVPSWADHNRIKEIYAKAAQLRELGLEVDVDHIVPLQGHLASGLHTHDNLQILLASNNRSKRNAVDFDAYDIPAAA